MTRTHNTAGWHKLIPTMLVFRHKQESSMSVACEETPPGTAMRFKFPALAMLLLSVLFPGKSMAMLENTWLGGDPNAYLPQQMYKKGAVYTRQIVLGPTGLPQYVGYDVDGSEAAYYGEIQGGKVLSATYYNALLAQLNQLKTQFPQLELLDRNTYSARQFTTVNGDSITSPKLAQDTVLVAVRPASQLFTPDTNPVLMESPVDLRYGPIDTNIQSLLLNEDGTVNSVSIYNVGPRVAYYGDMAAAQGSGVYNPGSAKRSNNDTIFGPLPGLLVEVGAGLGYGITDTEGKYHINYTVPACPGFTIMYPNWVFVTMNYHRFNPKGLADHPRPLYWKNEDFCNGLGALSMDAANIVNSSAVAIEPIRDFPIDLSVVNGRAQMGDNVVVNSGDTTYDSSRADLSRVIQDRYNNYDFDRDGITDKVAMGRIINDTTSSGTSLTLFEVQPASDKPQLMGIWLSSRHDLSLITANPGDVHGAPDLTRLTDWSADFEDRALLSQLNADDLLDTDLYVFRESDGSLLMERRGLKEQELNDARVGVANGGTAFEYTLRFLSRPNSTMNAGMSGATNADEFTTFQVREGVLNEALQQRDADQLRPGEQLRIVAINRPTGYIGSTIATLGGASSYGSSVNVDIQTDDIVLAPPNLKVWAERSYEVQQGYTASTAQKQNVQQHVIGSEGAGLTNDIFINLYTEWLDADDHPLPSALSEYGYTGRMAILTEGNQFKTFGNDYLANFAIKPGRQLQVIQLPGGVETNQHFYIHVTGTPNNRDPKFTATEKGTGILQFRPDRFVPLRVPLYDEGATSLQMDAWHQARAAGNSSLEKPEPMYQWVYRPEFQFTRYDLTVSELRRTDVTGRTEDLLPMEIPVVAGDDQLLDLFYSLYGPLQSDNSLLQALQSYSYNGNQELVFSLGEQEILAHVDGSGNVVFDNLAEIFASLNADDLLTLLEEKTINLRLYANNDPGNVLWEFGIDPGLSISYRLPYVEHTIKRDPDSPEAYPVFRTLGGVRLRLHYDPLSTENVKKYEWKIELSGTSKNIVDASPGWFMNDDTTALPDMTPNTQTVYWEPSDWTYYGSGTSEFDFEGTLLLTMADGSTVTKKFRIDRRLLQPSPPPENPMKGADVAMLEEMLWQLGISPQYGYPGSQGDRIDTIKPKDDGISPHPRNVFSVGYKYATNSNARSTAGVGTIEKMVRRFQGRLHSKFNARAHAGAKRAGKVDGVMRPSTLDALGKVWAHYFDAYVAFPRKSKFTLNDVPNTWLDSVAALMDAGGTVPYVGAGATYAVPATYTSTMHGAITSEFPADAANLTVPSILRAWLAQETGGHLWGFGYPNTPYRITEGGADEYASMSFHHILWMRLYGTEKLCNALRGYTGGTTIMGDNDNINLYHPMNSLLAFMVASTSQDCGSSNGFYYAYNAPGIASTANASTKPVSYCYESDASVYNSNIKVPVNRCSENSAVWKSYGGSDDAYDVLMKAIMMYNMGVGSGARNTKEAMVDRLRTDTAVFLSKGSLLSTKYAYPMQIKQLSWNKRLTGGGYLPYRTYIWKGAGLGLDINKDGKIADVPPDPTATPPKPAVVETSVPWCFAYGEKDWMEGKVWDDVLQDASDTDARGNPQTPVGRIACN